MRRRSTDAPQRPLRRISKSLNTAPRLSRCAAVGLLVALAATSVSADEPPQPAAPHSDLSPAVVDTLAPVLADWIVRSRDAAVAQGVAEIPAPIRSALAGYVPEATLSRVRWRAGGAAAMSVQQSVFAFGDVFAVTLDYVIVFADEQDALEDPKLWAHELKHVMQFADWGVAGFATRYLRDDWAVEKEADDYRWEFMKQKGLTPPPAPVR